MLTGRFLSGSSGQHVARTGSMVVHMLVLDPIMAGPPVPRTNYRHACDAMAESACSLFGCHTAGKWVFLIGSSTSRTAFMVAVLPRLATSETIIQIFSSSTVSPLPTITG